MGVLAKAVLNCDFRHFPLILSDQFALITAENECVTLVLTGRVNLDFYKKSQTYP